VSEATYSKPRLVWCAVASHVGRGQRPPQAGYSLILEILKSTRFGINAALKEGNPRWNGGRNQTNKPNRNQYAK